ncbi:MAG: HNH endonuclease [Actinobacteria bacterium]|nr:MAG: HNH endonuclease [Actinomycetota bacterium]
MRVVSRPRPPRACGTTKKEADRPRRPRCSLAGRLGPRRARARPSDRPRARPAPGLRRDPPGADQTRQAGPLRGPQDEVDLAGVNLALCERDGGCRFPGCTNQRWVDAHHIVHWSRGGPTDPENLCLLCRRHHRAVHEGGFTVTGNANSELVFRNPRGERIENSPKPPPGSHRALIEQNHDAGHRIDPDTLLVGDGERMDLEECVYAVAKSIKGPRREVISS